MDVYWAVPGPGHWETQCFAEVTGIEAVLGFLFVLFSFPFTAMVSCLSPLTPTPGDLTLSISPILPGSYTVDPIWPLVFHEVFGFLFIDCQELRG